MGSIASQITSLMIVYSTVYSDADQRKKTSKPHVTGLCAHKWPVMRKCFHLMTSSCLWINLTNSILYLHHIPQYIIQNRNVHISVRNGRADSRLATSQWEMSLQSNTVSHWLGANLKSALEWCTVGYGTGPMCSCHTAYTTIYWVALYRKYECQHEIRI